MVAESTKELIESLHSDRVSQVQRAWRAWGVGGIVGLLAYVQVLHPLIVQINWRVVEPAKEKVEQATESIAPDTSKIPQEGDTVAGYKVTSGYGPRPKPCPKCSDFHPAIDLATPKGTSLYLAIPSSESVKVLCWNDSKGGGLVGEYKADGVLRQFLHLSNCASGKRRGGQKFAETGNSGIGTGAHLDVRLKPREQKPTRALIFWTLKGKPMQPTLQTGGNGND